MLMTREIAIGENNRVTIELVVQRLGDGPAPDIACAGEVSRNGKLWVAPPELMVRALAPGTTLHVAPVSGERLRFVLASEGGAAAACAVDLRAHLERA